jgi:putative flippase GtrA
VDQMEQKHPITSTMKSNIFKRLWGEMLLAGRFALVGVAATVVHMLVVWVLIEKSSLFPLLSNCFAFLTAFGISFTGHYLWTFRAPGNPFRAMRRLFIISSAAFAMNSILLAGILKAEWLPPSTAAVLAAGIVPAITFLASRFWGFSTS